MSWASEREGGRLDSEREREREREREGARERGREGMYRAKRRQQVTKGGR